MEGRGSFGNIKGDYSSVEDEIKEARLFLTEAKNFFNQKKKGGKSKKVFTERTVLLIKSGLNEIEKIVAMRRMDIDIFILYRLRKNIEDLKEKIEYIESIEKL